MPLDKQTLDRYAYGGKLKVEILDRYAYEPEAKKPLIGPQPAPKWWEKELRTAGEFVKFPYTISKEFTYPIAKGTARAIPALFTSREKAQKIAREEIEPAAMQGVEMGKAFGGGVLDWLKMSLLPDTPAGIMAEQRIGERIKEHGYLAEAIHPAVLAGLVKGGAKRLATKKPSPLTARLEAIKKSDIGVPRKVIDKRLGDIPEPELVRPEMQPILDQILQPPKKAGPEPLRIPEKTTPTAALPDFVLGKEGRLMRTTKKRPVKVSEKGLEIRPGERRGPLYDRLRAVEETEPGISRTQLAERLRKVREGEIPTRKLKAEGAGEEGGLVSPERESLTGDVGRIVNSGVFRDGISELIKKDGQKVIDATRRGDISTLEGLMIKYARDKMRDQGGGGAGPGKVKQARRGGPAVFEAARRALEKLRTEPPPAPAGKAKPAAKPLPSPAREPWERTQTEHIGVMPKKPTGEIGRFDYKQKVLARDAAKVYHKNFVKQALSEGKPVPEPVLAEYPELKAKARPQPWEKAVRKIEILDKKEAEFAGEAKQILSTSAYGQAPPIYGRTLDKGNVIRAKKAKIWNEEIRNYVVPGTNKTFWQAALEKLVVKSEGKEHHLNFGASEIRALTKPPELGKKSGVKAKIDLAEQKALDRMKKRGTRLTAGIDPAEMADLAIIGAAKIAKGTIKFGEWSAEMVREYGVRVKPYLDEIWSRSQSQVKGARERGFVASTKEQFPEMRKKVAGQYIPRSTDDLAVKARNLIKDDIAKAEELVKTGTDESAVATAAELIKHYNERAQKGAGNEVFYSEAAKVANDMAVKLTDLGRAVQAASILGRLTPEGMLRFAAKEIQKWNIKHPTKRIKGLTSEQTKHILTESKRINEMAEGWQKGKAARDLQNYIGDLTPSPLWKKLINIWKAGLLTGIKTSGLNDMSNLFHGISETIKDVPAAGIDRVASLFTGKRTLGLTVRGVRGSIEEGFRKGWRYMKTGFDERNIAIKLDWKRVSFGKSRFARILQTYEQLVFRSMGAQDQPFYYGAKARSLASQAIAQAKNNKLKGAQVKRFIDNLIENPTDEMLKNAVNDAEISVFQNRTYLGEAGKAVQKIPGGEAIVPFARTPSAVATQLVNYSPVGIVKTIVGNIGKGKFNQRAFSQGLGRGITGTAVIYIGGELFKKGLMTLDYPKSEKERKLWEMEGRKAHSIYFLGKWRNPNVLGPAGMALLVGGYFQQGIEETGSLWGGIAQATAGGAKSLTDQTFLRGINQVTDALDDPSRFLTGYVTGTAGSVIPTIGGDIARATDPIVRRVESPLQGIQARIPGLRQGLEPRIQAVGGETPRRGTFLETMIDPTRPSGLKPTPVVRELRRLWDAGHRVSPTQLGNKKGYEGLTPQQNTKLWKVTGRLLEDKLGRLVVAPKYGSLSDEKKADLIDKVVGKVKLQVRIGVALKVIQGLDRDETIKKLRELKEGGLITKQIINDPTFQEGVKKQLTPTER